MKILYIANARIPTEKAHGVQIMQTVSALAERGNEVVLLVPRRRTFVGDPFEVYQVPKNFVIHKLWCIDSVSLGKFGFFLQSLSFAFSAAWYVFWHGADAVYSRDPVALVLCPHSVRIFELHSALGVPLRFFAHIVAISHGLACYAIQQGVPPERVSVVHDAATLVPLEEKSVVRGRLGLPQETVFVGYVGKYRTMGVEKGVEEIIEVVGALSKNLSVGLLVVGLEPNEIEEVRGIANHAGIIEKNVILVPHVPHKTAQEYMRASDILVMNYPNLPHFALYMSPLKLFEYLASGNVTVTSDLPSVREVLTDESAVFFPVGDTGTLSRQLSELATNPAKREALGRSARELATHYTYALRAEKIESILTKP